MILIRVRQASRVLGSKGTGCILLIAANQILPFILPYCKGGRTKRRVDASRKLILDFKGCPDPIPIVTKQIKTDAKQIISSSVCHPMAIRSASRHCHNTMVKYIGIIIYLNNLLWPLAHRTSCSCACNPAILLHPGGTGAAEVFSVITICLFVQSSASSSHSVFQPDID